MKVLYISPRFNATNSGGKVVSRRNYDALCEFYKPENVISYEIYRKGPRNIFSMLLSDIFSLGFGGLSLYDKKQITHLIKQENIGLVYIDSSLFGCLSKYIKKRLPVKTIVFFHNIEFDFVKELIQCNRSYLHFYRVILAYLNEYFAVKYSDVIISLNNKDRLRLGSLYGREADYVIPVSIKNNASATNDNKGYSSPLNLLFFGSNFPPNVEAVEILINQILPHVNCHLMVAGSGMEQIAEKYPQSDKLSITGYVPDIDKMYQSADLVVMPIISGAGMKVKTAEALCYGKNILATTNALEGYDVDTIPGIYRCDSVHEFVNAINNFDLSLPRYNSHARDLYLTKYSDEACLGYYRQLLKNL